MEGGWGQTEVRVEHYISVCGHSSRVCWTSRNSPCDRFNSTVAFTGSAVRLSAVSFSLSHDSLAGISSGHCMLCDPALEASDWLAKQTISGSLSKLLFGKSVSGYATHLCVFRGESLSL